MGTTQQLIDEDGQVTYYKESSPYGQSLYSNSTPGPRYQFAGSLNDNDSGLSQMQHRFYIPGLGQFASADPLFTTSPEDCLGSPVECGGHGYAGNNPLAFIDPTGTRMVDPESMAGNWHERASAEWQGMNDGGFKRAIHSAAYHNDWSIFSGWAANSDFDLKNPFNARSVSLELKRLGMSEKGRALFDAGVGEALGFGMAGSLTSRAARRQAMRDANIPTSRPSTSQSGKPSRRQHTVDGDDGKPRVVTHHKKE